MLTVVSLGSLAALAALAAVGSASPAAMAAGILPEPTTTTTTPPLFFSTTTTAKVTVPPAVRATTTTTVAPTTTQVPSAATTTTSTTFPPGLLAIANSVRRLPPNSTFRLLAALQPLRDLGFSPQQAAIFGMGQFPVAGPATFADDWLEPRPGPVPRLHEGDDIVAAAGTPLRAPADGTLTYDTSDPAGYGVAAIVTVADGTYYLMGHLSATVNGLSTGAAVKQGQVVGFVGETGDATGPHCHFEVHPRGGAGIDPKPVLDRFLADALAAAPSLIAATKASQATATSVSVPVPVLQVFPSSDQAGLGTTPPTFRVPASGAGSGRPLPLTGAALASVVGVMAWMAWARRRGEAA